MKQAKGQSNPIVMADMSDSWSPIKVIDIKPPETVTNSETTGQEKKTEEVEAKIRSEHEPEEIEVLPEKSKSPIPIELNPTGKLEHVDFRMEIQHERFKQDQKLLAESMVDDSSDQEDLETEITTPKFSRRISQKIYQVIHDRGFFSDSEIPASKHSGAPKQLPGKINKSKSLVKQPLLFVDGRHVRRLSDTPKKLFNDITSNNTSIKLPKKEFMKYFRAQGMPTRNCRQLYYKFCPKAASSLSFREFNENILSLTLRVGEEPDEKPIKIRKSKRGKTIMRWDPTPR